MIHDIQQHLSEWYRTTDLRVVAGDLFATAIVLAAGYYLTYYLSLWEVATGEWTPASLGFGTSGPIVEFFLLAFPLGALTAPVFYLAWRLADRRYRHRLQPPELVVWLAFGVGLPVALATGYIALNLGDAFELVATWDGGPLFEPGTLRFYFGGAIAVTLLPSVFTGVYHRLSVGAWTPRTRGLHVTIAVVAVVLAAAVGASATLAPSPGPDASNDGLLDSDSAEYDTMDPASYRDGNLGPGFRTVLVDNQSYGGYVDAEQYACAETRPPDDPPEDYTPRTTHAGPGAFEIAAGQLSTDNGTETLYTRLSVRLENQTLNGTTVIGHGIYGENASEEYNYSVGAKSLYDHPGEYDNSHRGVEIHAENIDSVHIYVDVVRDGTVVRYTTRVCPAAGGDDGGA